jgi:hypothetical protein
MRQLTILDRPHAAAPVVDVGIPLLLTAALAYTSSYEVSVTQGVLAFLLCWMPWAAYRQWLRSNRSNIPLFTLLAAMFWLAYAVPLFWAQHIVTGVFGRRALTESAIAYAMFLAVLGVACLWLGMRLAAFFHWVPNIKRDVSSNPAQLNYLRVIFVLGTLVKVFVPITAFGAGGRQIVSNFENTVPVVSFAIFIRHYLRGRLPQLDKILIGGYSLIAVIVGISSGWLGSAVSVGLVCVVIYVYERRKFPVMALIVLPVILFFQPAKSMFRERYWARESADTSTQRVTFWVENSWQLWSDALTDQNSDGIRQLADSSLSRFDLLRQTAHVIEFTPSRVPYQYGSLYSYMGVTFIPRFLWPDKPSVNDANRWYQVSYGLTDPQQLSIVSIAVGTVAESYINFGWFGPLLVILPLGIFLGSFERIFLHSDSGLLFSCLGAVLVPHLVAIESQMAEYVAGMVQQIVLVFLVLVPTLEMRTQEREHPRPVPIPTSLKPGIPRPNPSVPRPAIVQRQSLGK